MRRFTIIGEGGEKIGEQTADFLSFAADGIVQFVAIQPAGEETSVEDVIAVSRAWSTITSEEFEPEPLDLVEMRDQAEKAIERVSGVPVISRGSLDAGPHPEPDETGVVDDPPPAPVKTAAEKAKLEPLPLVDDENTGLGDDSLDEIAAEQAFAVDPKAAEPSRVSVKDAEAAARARALALQTSGPDAPGATEETLTPDPGVQDDADAKPPAEPTAESTGDDHPPAAVGEAGDSTLRVAISTYMANRPDLNDRYVEWLWDNQIPTSISKATAEQLEQGVAWWAAATREGDDG